MEFNLHYGSGKLPVTIKDENFLGALYPNKVKTIGSEAEARDEILHAIENPIGSKPLRELLKPGQKVAVLVSDITRPSPTKLLLPPILDQLAEAGIRDEDITVLFGIGIHRPHTSEEQKMLVGEDIYGRIRCMDAKEGLPIVPMGETSRGTPIEIYAPVAEADIVIGTGNLDFHYAAGYASGAKVIMPGASSRRSIEIHHRFMIEEGSGVGLIKGNPFREDMEEIADIAGLDFIVTAIMTEEKELVKVVAGDFRAAHREGCKVIDQLYKIPIGEPGDIVIASAGGFPKDINMYQSQKTLENAKNAVKEGGIIILVSECRDGAGDDIYISWMKEAKSLDDVLERIRQKFVMGGHKAAGIARVMKKASVYAVTSMDADILKELRFFPKASVGEALEDAMKEKGKNAKIWVMPYGAYTLPYYINTNSQGGDAANS